VNCLGLTLPNLSANVVVSTLIQSKVYLMDIKIANPRDYQFIAPWDEFWGDRRQEIQRGEIFVAYISSDDCVGYIRLTRNDFFNYPFISNLCVRKDYRRKGIGIALLSYVETLLVGLKLFTSTELDNTATNNLLIKVGYKEIGFIDNINSDGKREFIYFKEII
jgi:ribosomal protein S18 acetylase RimI-like enzyme